MSAEHETTSWRFPLCPAPPTWELNFDALTDQFDWLRAMRGCPQDAEWHAEGDVHTHVGMVCAELVAMPMWRSLPADERHVLFAATLLHDVAKPRFTKEEDGRIRSRGHAVGGMRMARRILMEGVDFDVPPFGVREQIVGLVRHHGLPATVWDKPDPRRSAISASMTTPFHLLCILAEADARGRICIGGNDDAVDRAKLFAEFCSELGCLTKPYEFASANSRFRYFRTPDAEPTIEVYDASKCEVTVLSGLPAAGKDTWVRRYGGDQPVIALDELRNDLEIDPAEDQSRVIQAAKEQAKVYLRENRDFVWNATNTTRILREGLVDLFTAYGARVNLVYVESPLELIRQRNAARERPVPPRIVDKLIDHLDVPDLTEAQRVEWLA